MSLYLGDVRDGLRQFIAAGMRAQTCVTSPPYWGLRDYGTAQWAGGDEDCEHISGMARGDTERETPGGRGGSFRGGTVQYAGQCDDCGATRIDRQLGLEPTIAEYVANMVGVFRLVREVLADDGTLWLNLGDSYGGACENTRGEGAGGGTERGTAIFGKAIGIDNGVRAKDLCGIPWRVAFALQADGWYLRQDIIWAKPNPMPESVTDRCTKSHEYLFLLSKRATYYYDAAAIAEPAQQSSLDRYAYGADDGMINKGGLYREKHDANDVYIQLPQVPKNQESRNRRSVWTVTTQPYAEAHFATFPVALVEPCIMAGTSQRGHCPACGKGWERVVDRVPMEIARSERTHELGRTRASGTMVAPAQNTMRGWAPSCGCGLEPVPGVVLDPFMGSGTVAQVAQDLGRHWLGCELNPEYAKLIRRRTAQQALLLAAD